MRLYSLFLRDVHMRVDFVQLNRAADNAALRVERRTAESEADVHILASSASDAQPAVAAERLRQPNLGRKLIE